MMRGYHLRSSVTGVGRMKEVLSCDSRRVHSPLWRSNRNNSFSTCVESRMVSSRDPAPRAAAAQRLRASGARLECARGHHPRHGWGFADRKGYGTMTLRKRMPTALLGAALITLAVSALGGGSGPNFGDPLPGLTP